MVLCWKTIPVVRGNEKQFHQRNIIMMFHHYGVFIIMMLSSLWCFHHCDASIMMLMHQRLHLLQFHLFGPSNLHQQNLWRKSPGLPLRKQKNEVLVLTTWTISKTPHSSTPSTRDLGDSHHMLLRLGTQKFVTTQWLGFFKSPTEKFSSLGKLREHYLKLHASLPKLQQYRFQQKQKFKELYEEGFGVFNTICWNEAKLIY